MLQVIMLLPTVPLGSQQVSSTGQSYRFEDPYRIFAPNRTQGPEGFPECEDLGSRRVLKVDF